MKSVKLITEALKQPFNFNELRWRFQSSGLKDNNQNAPWAKIVPYVDKTAIENRLDDVFGLNGWEVSFIHLAGHVTANWEDPKLSWDQKKDNKAKNIYPPQVMTQRVSNAGFICSLNLQFGEYWVSKQGTANLTDIEAIKGGESNSFKRCAAKVGIGRYLYGIGESWANFGQQGDAFPNDNRIKGSYYYWAPKPLNPQFLPKAYTDKQVENWLDDSECREDMTYIWPRLSKEQRETHKVKFQTLANKFANGTITITGQDS